MKNKKISALENILERALKLSYDSQMGNLVLGENIYLSPSHATGAILKNLTGNKDYKGNKYIVSSLSMGWNNFYSPYTMAYMAFTQCGPVSIDTNDKDALEKAYCKALEFFEVEFSLGNSAINSFQPAFDIIKKQVCEDQGWEEAEFEESFYAAASDFYKSERTYDSLSLEGEQFIDDVFNELVGETAEDFYDTDGNKLLDVFTKMVLDNDLLLMDLYYGGNESPIPFVFVEKEILKKPKRRYSKLYKLCMELIDKRPYCVGLEDRYHDCSEWGYEENDEWRIFIGSCHDDEYANSFDWDVNPFFYAALVILEQISVEAL